MVMHPLEFHRCNKNMDVISVKATADFQLELEFANGEHKRFDMKPLLKMKPWNCVANRKLFETVQVDYGTVTWLNGDIDVAPETLYDRSITI
ncbi:MAG: DUF2442 domain-containing protein [Methylococcales bacterium]|nr:DUF2442 domain-containing protein [Methylococcales bacterium]MDD5754931.1 DUF2442 domain-containing protein [Methylococcales bacterium]